MAQDREKSIYGRLLFALIILGIVAVVYILFPSSGNTKTPPASASELVLRVQPFEIKDITLSTGYVGYVTPINSVNVQPQIEGYLQEIWVEGGQEVKAGDNLVLIQPDEYKARLDAAKAAVTQTQAEYNNAELYYRRVRQAGAKAISKTEVDNAKAKYLSAQASLSEAKANQALAQVNYDYTQLQAPIDGIVGNVGLTRGNYVSPSSGTLFSIIQYDPIRVVFSMTDKEYLAAQTKNPKNLLADDKIRLRLSDGRMYSGVGKFKYTANQIDRSTNSIAVYADFDNPERELVSNAYVDVLLEKNYKDITLIRQKYVNLDAGGEYIYTIKGNSLLKTPVKVLGVEGDSYVVANRFAENEYLVVDKIGRLPENVKIVPKLVSGSQTTVASKEKH